MERIRTAVMVAQKRLMRQEVKPASGSWKSSKFPEMGDGVVGFVIGQTGPGHFETWGRLGGFVFESIKLFLDTIVREWRKTLLTEVGSPANIGGALGMRGAFGH